MGKVSRRRLGKSRSSKRIGKRGGFRKPPYRDLADLEAALRELWNERKDEFLASIGSMSATVTGTLMLEFFIQYGGLDSLGAMGEHMVKAAGHLAGVGLETGIALAQTGQAGMGAVGSIIQTTGLGVLWLFSGLQRIMPSLSVNLGTVFGIGVGATAVAQLYRTAVNNDLVSAIPEVQIGSLMHNLAVVIAATNPGIIRSQAERDAEWQAIQDAATGLRAEDDNRLLSFDHFRAIVGAIMNKRGLITRDERQQIEDFLACPSIASPSAVALATSGEQAKMMAEGYSASQPTGYAEAMSSVLNRSYSLPTRLCQINSRAGWDRSLQLIADAYHFELNRQRSAALQSQYERQLDEYLAQHSAAVMGSRGRSASESGLLLQVEQPPHLQRAQSMNLPTKRGLESPGSSQSTVLDEPPQTRRRPNSPLGGDEEETKDEDEDNLIEEKEDMPGGRRTRRRRSNKRGGKKRRITKRRKGRKSKK